MPHMVDVAKMLTLESFLVPKNAFGITYWAVMISSFKCLIKDSGVAFFSLLINFKS